MKDPATDRFSEARDDQCSVKKEYVRPTIDEGIDLPVATATAFTPVTAD